MTSDTGGGFVHSVGATEGANEKTVAAFGRFHRSEFESNATRRSRCNLGEVERGRIDSGGDTSGGCDTTSDLSVSRSESQEPNSWRARRPPGVVAL